MDVFPEPIRRLPEADIPIRGVTSYLSQAADHQIIFMVFSEDVNVPEHAHAAQLGIVLEGKIHLTLDGAERTYVKGDRYYIPAGSRHGARICAGYADITFFDEPGRYHPK